MLLGYNVFGQSRPIYYYAVTWNDTSGGANLVWETTPIIIPFNMTRWTILFGGGGANFTLAQVLQMTFDVSPYPIIQPTDTLFDYNTLVPATMRLEPVLTYSSVGPVLQNNRISNLVRDTVTNNTFYLETPGPTIRIKIMFTVPRNAGFLNWGYATGV